MITNFTVTDSPFAIAELPTPLVVFLVVLVLIQIALMATALVNLYHRPKHLVLGGNKVLWVVLIVLFGTIGPIVYLVVGRVKTTNVDLPSSRENSSTEIADRLYGSNNGQ